LSSRAVGVVAKHLAVVAALVGLEPELVYL
jgi:hypothetical protein